MASPWRERVLARSLEFRQHAVQYCVGSNEKWLDGDGLTDSQDDQRFLLSSTWFELASLRHLDKTDMARRR